MSDKLTAEEHLLRMIALCQVPKEEWSSSDRQMWVSARKFIQQWQEKNESRDEERDSDLASLSREGESSKEASRKVREDVESVEERAQDLEKTGGAA